MSNAAREAQLIPRPPFTSIIIFRFYAHLFFCTHIDASRIFIHCRTLNSFLMHAHASTHIHLQECKFTFHTRSKNLSFFHTSRFLTWRRNFAYLRKFTSSHHFVSHVIFHLAHTWTPHIMFIHIRTLNGFIMHAHASARTHLPEHKLLFDKIQHSVVFPHIAI